MTNELKHGMYVRTENIKDTEQWKAIIEAFEKAGFSSKYEGYGKIRGSSNYSDHWRSWSYVGVDDGEDIMHYLGKLSYGAHSTEVSVEYVLGLVVKPECEFAVGDTVEIVDNRVYCGVKVGDRGVIAEILPCGDVTINFDGFIQEANLRYRDFVKVDSSEASCTSHVDTLNDTPSVGIQGDVESPVGSPETVETKPKITVTAETTYTLTIQGNVLILNEQEFADLHRALEAI